MNPGADFFIHSEAVQPANEVFIFFILIILN